MTSQLPDVPAAARPGGRFGAALASRRLPVAGALLAVLLTLPSLGNGRQTEDHLQRLLGWTLHLYPRGTGDVFENYARKDLGILPWIASEDLKIAFFRPLASLSLSADHQLWPSHPWLAHAHSLLWLAVLVVAAGQLFRRVTGCRGYGGVAALLFAVHDGHGLAAGWLAARHGLMATALVVLSLVAHDRWRREGWRAGAVVGPALWLLALLSSETALAGLGLFVAHLLVLDGAPPGRRASAASAFLVPVACWLVPYVAGDYGVAGSGMYVSPLVDPLGAAREAVLRLPWVWVRALGGSAEWGFWLRPEHRAAGAAIAAAVSLLVGLFLFARLRRRPGARFWMLSLVLAAPAFTAALPTDRLLGLPVLAGMGLVAELFDEVLGERAPMSWPSRLLARGLLAVWLGVHGLVSPVLLPVRSRTLVELDAALDRASRDLCTGLVPGQHLVVVQAPDYYFGTLLAWISLSRGCPTRHVRVLYAGVEPLTLERVDTNTLVLSAPSGFLTSPLSRVYRGPSRPSRVGDTLSLTDVQITVTRVNARHEPTEVSFRFAWDLDRPGARFMGWQDGRYAPLVVPAVGERRALPAMAP